MHTNHLIHKHEKHVISVILSSLEYLNIDPCFVGMIGFQKLYMLLINILYSVIGNTRLDAAVSGIHWDMSLDLSSGLAAALLGHLVNRLDKVSGCQTFWVKGISKVKTKMVNILSIYSYVKVVKEPCSRGHQRDLGFM